MTVGCDGERLVIAVADRGRGMPADGPAPAGTGLVLARTLADLTIAPRAGGGTEATLILALAPRSTASLAED